MDNLTLINRRIANAYTKSVVNESRNVTESEERDSVIVNKAGEYFLNGTAQEITGKKFGTDKDSAFKFTKDGAESFIKYHNMVGCSVKSLEDSVEEDSDSAGYGKYELSDVHVFRIDNSPLVESWASLVPWYSEADDTDYYALSFYDQRGGRCAHGNGDEYCGYSTQQEVEGWIADEFGEKLRDVIEVHEVSIDEIPEKMRMFIEEELEESNSVRESVMDEAENKKSKWRVISNNDTVIDVYASSKEDAVEKGKTHFGGGVRGVYCLDCMKSVK